MSDPIKLEYSQHPTPRPRNVFPILAFIILIPAYWLAKSPSDAWPMRLPLIAAFALASMGLVRGWFMRRGRIVSVLALLACLLILPAAIREHAQFRSYRNAERCISNLTQIGWALLEYSSNHDGKYPPTLDAVIKEAGLSQKVLACPNTGKPYIYLACGKTTRLITADTVLAYDDLAGREGTHVLFGDGHVDWVSKYDLSQVLTRATTAPSPNK